MGVGTAASNPINQNGSRLDGGFVTQEELNELAAKDKWIINLMRLRADVQAQGTTKELKAAMLEVCEQAAGLHRKLKQLQKTEKALKIRVNIIEEKIRQRLLEIKEKANAKYIRKLRRKMGGQYVKLVVGECRQYRYRNLSSRLGRQWRMGVGSAPLDGPQKSSDAAPLA